MNAYARALMFAAILLGGCRASRDVAATSYHVTRGVAVGSYRVATAPVHYALRRHGDESSPTVTMETTSSGEAGASQSVPASEVAVTQQQPKPQPAMERSPNRSSTTVSRASRKEGAQARPKPSPSSRASSAQGEFPTAKAVPGKPGYVVSPFDSSGRYVDVSGYTSGSKVKDPWTDKIFIVP
jgi:hypothetical protein